VEEVWDRGPARFPARVNWFDRSLAMDYNIKTDLAFVAPTGD